jgi:hypothetical protein
MEIRQGDDRRRAQDDRRRALVDMRQVELARKIVALTLKRRALEEQISGNPQMAEANAEQLGQLAREWLMLDLQFKAAERQQQAIKDRRAAERRSGDRSPAP